MAIATDSAARAVKPATQPADTRFSAGPTRKRPGWSLDALSDAALGRSHRSAIGKAKLKEVIDLALVSFLRPIQVPWKWLCGQCWDNVPSWSRLGRISGKRG